jgi:hypothetical protein
MMILGARSSQRRNNIARGSDDGETMQRTVERRWKLQPTTDKKEPSVPGGQRTRKIAVDVKISRGSARNLQRQRGIHPRGRPGSASPPERQSDHRRDDA